MLQRGLLERCEPDARYLSPLRISWIWTEPASPPRAGPCARPPLSPPAGAALFLRRVARTRVADRPGRYREPQVNGMRSGELIEITNRLRGRSFQVGDFVVERWYGCGSIRARQPGTHVRPAAGGVSAQVRPRIVAIRRQRTASLTDREGARLVARHGVLRGGAPARGAACILVRWPAPGPRIPGGLGICPAAGPPGLDLKAESWHHIRRLATHRGSLPPRGARAIGSRGTDRPVRPEAHVTAPAPRPNVKRRVGRVPR